MSHISPAPSRDECRHIGQILDVIAKDSAAAIFVIDLQGKFLMLNRAAEQFIGKRADELIGLDETHIFPHEQAQAVIADNRLVMESGAPHVFEELVRSATGEDRTFLVSKYPIHESNGEIFGMCGIAQDITEWQRINQALRESEARLRLLTQSITGYAIFMLDTEGRIASWNEGARNLTGYEEFEVLGQSVACFYEPDAVSDAVSQCLNGAARNLSHQHEGIRVRKDGARFLANVITSPMLGKANEIVGYVKVVRDVTKERQLQSELQDRCEQLVRVEAMARLGSWELNLSDDMLTWSDEIYRIFGVRADQFKPTDTGFMALVHPDDREAVDLAYQESLSSDAEGYDIEHRIVLPATGEIRYVHEKCRHIRNELGEITRSAGMVQDITEQKQTEGVLAQERARFAMAIEAAPVAMLMMNDAGTIGMTNTELLSMFGYQSAEILGQPLDRLLPRAVRGHHQLLFAGYLANPSIRLMGRGRELSGLHKDGRLIPVEISLSQMTLANESVVIAAITDITERKKQIESLRERELRYSSVIETNPDGFWVVDRDHRLVLVNAAYCQMSGYSREELLRLSIFDLDASENAEETKAHVDRITRTGHDRFETTHRRKDGTVWPAEITVSALADFGELFVFVRDLTEIKAMERERECKDALIREMAFRDPLTNLPNRRLLLDRLRQAVSTAHRDYRYGALLFIDLDKFKLLNDTLGHDAGDLLLIAVAQRLNACMREEDTVARLGGDEFVVMLPKLSDQREESLVLVQAVGEKILDSLNQPFLLGEMPYSSTPSIGITLFGEGDMDADSVLKRADAAMYRVKKAGRNGLHIAR